MAHKKVTPELAAGKTEVTVDTLPQKPTMLATMKSTNYLLNSLVASHAERKGGCFGVQVDAHGMLAEGSVCNVAFVLKVRNTLAGLRG